MLWSIPVRHFFLWLNNLCLSFLFVYVSLHYMNILPEPQKPLSEVLLVTYLWCSLHPSLQKGSGLVALYSQCSSSPAACVHNPPPPPTIHTLRYMSIC